jgi:hypothetical protein
VRARLSWCLFVVVIVAAGAAQAHVPIKESVRRAVYQYAPVYAAAVPVYVAPLAVAPCSFPYGCDSVDQPCMRPVYAYQEPAAQSAVPVSVYVLSRRYAVVSAYRR